MGTPLELLKMFGPFAFFFLAVSVGSSLAGYPQAVLPPKETCRTVYEDQSNRRCFTSYKQECSTSYSQSCSTEYVNECSTEYTKDCSYGTASKFPRRSAVRFQRNLADRCHSRAAKMCQGRTVSMKLRRCQGLSVDLLDLHMATEWPILFILNKHRPKK